MKTEDDWRVDQRNVVDCIEETFESSVYWLDVIVIGCFGKEEVSVFIKEEVSHILFQVSHKDSSVPVISDSTSVHGLTDQIFQRIPWNGFIFILERFFQVHVQQFV